MKIVVIGGSGLIGSKVVSLLRKRGHGSTKFGDWLRQTIIAG